MHKISLKRQLMHAQLMLFQKAQKYPNENSFLRTTKESFWMHLEHKKSGFKALGINDSYAECIAGFNKCFYAFAKPQWLRLTFLHFNLLCLFLFSQFVKTCCAQPLNLILFHRVRCFNKNCETVGTQRKSLAFNRFNMLPSLDKTTSKTGQIVY